MPSIYPSILFTSYTALMVYITISVGLIGSPRMLVARRSEILSGLLRDFRQFDCHLLYSGIDDEQSKAAPTAYEELQAATRI